MNEVINKKELDELFRDYYRHRENSVLQLVLLLFSKKESDKKENTERIENIVTVKSGPDLNRSTFMYVLNYYQLLILLYISPYHIIIRTNGFLFLTVPKLQSEDPIENEYCKKIVAKTQMKVR